MKKNKSKLQPCPFCGSDAELIEVDEYVYCVSCKQCNASTDYLDTQLGAVASWQDRSVYERKLFFRYLFVYIVLTIVYFTSLAVIAYLMQ